MTGKEKINRDVDKFKTSKRKEMAKKMLIKNLTKKVNDTNPAALDIRERNRKY